MADVRQMLAERYGGGPITNATSRLTYSAAERDLAPSVRPGAMEAFALPSRHGTRLVWPKGQDKRWEAMRPARLADLVRDPGYEVTPRELREIADACFGRVEALLDTAQRRAGLLA